MTDHLKEHARQAIISAIDDIEFMSLIEQFDELSGEEVEKVYDLILGCDLEVKFK